MNQIVVPIGYMGSGSSALTDLLTEIEGYNFNNGDFEYVLLHCPDGLFDLEDKLLNGNNAIRSDEAIHRFLECVNTLYDTRGYWISSYKTKVTDRFLEYSKEFINDLGALNIDDGFWYYQQNPNTLKMKTKKIIRGLVRRLTLNKVVLSEPLLYNEMNIAFPSDKQFYTAAKAYLNKIYDALGYSEHNLVLDQFLLPHNLFRIDNYFDDNLRVIVVDRDPRDVFVLNKYFWHKQGGSVPYPCDVEKFVEYYGRMRRNERIMDDKRILRVHFEDLVYDYENTLEKVFELLDVNSLSHKAKMKMFNPKVSINNTQVFKRSDCYKKESEFIADHLEEYIYNFRFGISTLNSKVF